jgi:lipoprotein-releasing system ATP-binding protein
MNQSQNVALIVVTHDLELAAKLKRQYRLIDGKLLAVS